MCADASMPSPGAEPPAAFNASNIHVRMAVRPSGALSIPSARSALCTWLLARKYEAPISLEIQNVGRGSMLSAWATRDAPLQALGWLGLDWDGPLVVQTNRTPAHERMVHDLLSRGRAHRYDAAPDAAVVLAPQPGDRLVVIDALRGDIAGPAASMGTIVLRRGSGAVTYDAAVAIDQHHYGVTHVIARAEFFKSHTLAQAAILAELGARPSYLHLPQILTPDGALVSSQLPPRYGPATIHDLQAEHRPGVVRNYLAELLGCYPNGTAGLRLDQLVEDFQVELLRTDPVVFDPGALRLHPDPDLGPGS